ncbi:MAG: sigma-70 family RNA polymerase sigma factor [Planctomycetota bacterium]
MDVHSTATPTPEELLEHLPWVRALARRLVADPSAADDIAQDSMVVALRKPPRSKGGDVGGLRPWLAAVVRNTARQRARSESRRSHREEAGAWSEVLPSAHELTARAEGQRLLLDALLVLDDEARRLVLLRFDDGLSAAEIARRTGQNHSTVRSQLKRALDRLRCELDERHGGDRSAWLAGLAPLLREPSVQGVGAAVVPGTIMVAALLALAAVSVGIVALATGLASIRGTAETVDVVLPGSPGSLAVVEAIDPERKAATRTAVMEFPAGRELSPSGREMSSRLGSQPSSHLKAEFGEVKLRFVDEDGRPIEGVRVEARGSEPMVSDQNGRLDFIAWFGPRGTSTRLDVECFGFASDVILTSGRSGEAYELGDVVLQRGGDLAGVVADGDGRPVPGLSVSVRGRLGAGTFSGGIAAQWVTDLGATEDVTDAEGRFHLRGVLAGLVDVEVASGDGVWSGEAQAVRVQAGERTSNVAITAEEAPVNTRIEGIVRDHLGAPAKGAFIVLEWGGWFSRHRGVAEADERGCFVAVVDPRALVKLDVCARGSMVGLATHEDVRAGTLDLDVRLREPCERVVRVADAAGMPIAGAGVRLRTTAGGLGRRYTQIDGTARIPLATHGMRVIVEAQGYASESIELDGASQGIWDAALRGEFEELLVTMDRVALLSGGIRTEEGAADGCEISVLPIAARRVLVGGLPSLVEDEVVAEGRTDRSGRFALTVDAAGTFLARVEAPGFAPLWIGPFEHDPSNAPDGGPAGGLDLGTHALLRGGILKGRVIDGDGAQQRRIVRITHGDGFMRSTTTSTAGDYAFENVMPGPCFVRVVDRSVQGRGAGSNTSIGRPFRAIEGDVLVRDGETVVHGLWTGRAAEGIEVAGRLVCDGFDASRFSASLVPLGPGVARAEFSASVPLDADGTFVLRQAAPGRHALSLRDTSSGADGENLTLAAVLELGPGLNRWESRVSFGEVRTGEHADPMTERVFVELSNGLFAFGPLAEVGVVRPFPAGEVRRVSLASYHASLLALDQGHLDVLETASLPPGGIATVGD